MTGPLDGLRVFDLSRILAGPSCTQMLGDLGADIIKIERPGVGDDTRGWGPPYLSDDQGQNTSEAAYYLAANRNKRSISLDIEKPEGQALARKLIGQCDILVENFKTGGLAKYGLGYEQLKDQFPSLIYCSITGFGQTGPYAERAGYDYLLQGLGGIMSITGEPQGEPVKAGVAIADLITGLHATIAILAALHHRDATGQGQHIDLALLDATVALLANQGLNYLVSGQVPPRMGNAHPNIVPYQVFAVADGHMILAVGNDAQFARYCDCAGRPDLATDDRFRTNSGRVRHREQLVPILEAIMRTRTLADWIAGLEALKVPCSPINQIDQVFADPQVQHRGMQIAMTGHAATGQPVPLIAYPAKLSATPASYRRPPPMLGQHTDSILQDMLGLDDQALADLHAKKVI